MITIHLNDTDRRLGLFLICILIAAYLLAYVAQPDSADERAIIATSASLIQHGRLDMNAVGASDWLLLPLSRIGTFGTDNALYAKKGPTPALLLTPLVLLGQVLPWLSIRASAMLFNLLVTACTALLVYVVARCLRYRPRSALLAALIYGLCTLAFVYVKTVFGEPLVGLLLLLAVFSGWQTRQVTARQPLAWLAVCSAALTFIVGVNTIYIVLVPFLFVYAFYGQAVRIRKLLVFALPLMAGALLLMGFNVLRFGSPFQTGYNFALGEGFTHPFLRGVYGLLVGPQRGIFWYNPVLLLAIPGFLVFLRTWRSLGWTLFILIIVQVVAFASWWSWHGGIVWGPRFLIPALPLAILFLLPLLESTGRHPFIAFILFAFSLLSFGVQLLGVLFSYFPYIGYLSTQFEPFGLNGILSDKFFFDPQLSPIVGHFIMLLTGYPVQPAWLMRGVSAAFLAASITLVLVGLIALLANRPRLNRWLPLVSVAAIMIALNVAVVNGQNTPQEEDIRSLDGALTPPAMTVAASLLFDDSLVDIRNGSRVVSMNAPTAPDDERAVRLWNYALRQGRLLWFVNWFAPGQPENWQEQQLWQTHYFVAEHDAAKHRALLFDLSPDSGTSHMEGWRFENGISLNQDAIWATPDGVYIRLEWHTAAPLKIDSTWFVHLLDPSGQIIAQQDRAPLGGYAPTSGWQPDEPVIDRLFFPVRRGDYSGWKVRIGYISPTDGKPVAVTDATGKRMADPFILLDVTSGASSIP